MRYRPFNQAGLAVSAITLTLDDGPISQAQRIGLVFAALECGINSFELASLSPDCTAAVRAAIEAAGRDVLVLMLRQPSAKEVGGGHLTLSAEVKAGLEHAGAEKFDAVLIQAGGSPSLEDTKALQALRTERLTRMIGVVCGPNGPTVDLMVGYDLIATPFGLRSDAGLRKRLRAMFENNITLMGFDFDACTKPQAALGAPKGLSRLFKRAAVDAASDAYGFLHRVPDWTADALALAYTLTETTLSTVRVQTTDIAVIHRLAAAVERDLPTGAAAQIEVARFSTPA